MATRTLPSPTAPTALLAHLFAVLYDTKRTRVKETLQRGLVHVNGTSVTRHDHALHPGDTVEVRDGRSPAARVLPFPVLFEDASLLAIEKPCGLLTIATDNEKDKTVHAIVNAAFAATRERLFIVHRLDKFTSGVLLLAKSETVKHRVMGNWKAAEKVYHALVEGTPSVPRRTLVHHLREDEHLVVHAMDAPRANSQRAVLAYEVLRAGGTHALLRIDLETGRKNQIRAQLAAIGHPIAGDAKYGARSNPINRLCLHASSLSIPHPVSGARLLFESAMPREMENAVPGPTP